MLQSCEIQSPAAMNLNLYDEEQVRLMQEMCIVVDKNDKVSELGW